MDTLSSDDDEKPIQNRVNEIFLEQQMISNEDCSDVLSEAQNKRQTNPKSETIDQISNKKQKHICEICEKSFNSKAQVKRHITSIHKIKKSKATSEKANKKKTKSAKNEKADGSQEEFICATCSKMYEQN